MLDMGAHLGEFSHELIARWSCKCVAVEANPQLFKLILRNPLLSVINAAIYTESGRRDFFIHANPEASSLCVVDDHSLARVESVRALSLSDLFRESGVQHVALLKMDVEGAEIAILNHLPESLLQRCDQITVEFHDSFISTINKKDVEVVITRLEASGFFAFSFSRAYTDVLFVRRDARLLANWEAFFIRYVLRYVLALERRLQGIWGKAASPKVDDTSRH